MGLNIGLNLVVVKQLADLHPKHCRFEMWRVLTRQYKAPAILARLAVDLQHQGAGLGKALLKDTLLRTAQAADIAGIRALLVHAKDEPARLWYLNWEFESSPSDPFHLFFLMKDIKAMVGKA